MHNEVKSGEYFYEADTFSGIVHWSYQAAIYGPPRICHLPLPSLSTGLNVTLVGNLS